MEKQKNKKTKQELTLKDDLVFKFFFSKKGNEKYLKSFLEAILKIKIKEIEVMQEVDLYKLTIDEKAGRLDIKAKTDKGEIINIEMQMNYDRYFEKRSSYYGSRLVSEQLEEGNKYKILKPVILINILNFNILKVPEYHSETITVLKEHRDYEVMKDVKYHFIELPKFRKSNPKLVNSLECWLAILDQREGELVEMAKKKEKIIKEAKEELEEVLSDKALKEIQEYRFTAKLEENSRLDNAKEEGIELGLEKGKEIGKEEGIKLGIASGVESTAREMLKLNLDIEIIKKVTGLSKERIYALK